MKQIITLSILALAALTSCKKEFDLNLNDSNKNYLVVEGMITDQDEPQTIRLSRTISYLEAKNPQKVNDAAVTIQFDNTTIPFNLSSDGVYAAPAGFRGEVGKTYHLKIQVDGQQYEASSTMRKGQKLDSVYTQKHVFNTDQFEIRANLTENPEKGDYVLLKYAQNEVLQDSVKRWSFYSDNVMNGEKFENMLIFGDIEGKVGDKITVYTYSISKETFDFVTAASSSLMEPLPFFPPPGASIKGNISNGALGYFQASAVFRKDSHLKK